MRGVVVGLLVVGLAVGCSDGDTEGACEALDRWERLASDSAALELESRQMQGATIEERERFIESLRREVERLDEARDAVVDVAPGELRDALATLDDEDATRREADDAAMSLREWQYDNCPR